MADLIAQACGACSSCADEGNEVVSGSAVVGNDGSSPSESGRIEMKEMEQGCETCFKFETKFKPKQCNRLTQVGKHRGGCLRCAKSTLERQCSRSERSPVDVGLGAALIRAIVEALRTKHCETSSS